LVGTGGSEAVEYEVTRYAVAWDPEAARRAASEVPVDVSREGSTVMLETDGGGQIGADSSVGVPSGGESERGDVTVHTGPGDVTVRNVAGDVPVEAGGATSPPAASEQTQATWNWLASPATCRWRT
jgi:hypothetical protein